MLFDKHHNFLDAAWDQLDEAYEQTSTPPAKDPFDHLMKQMIVREEGYAYIFVSNENPTKVDIHFDDFTVTHKKTNVIQYNEYYPFGLQTNNSWTRENHSNKFLYNGGVELNGATNWYETLFRGYDPSLGRFMQIDPLASSFASFTPYNYGNNNPITYNDPSGLAAVWFDEFSEWAQTVVKHNDMFADPTLGWYGNRGGFASQNPGSGNHWSDAYSTPARDYFLMSNTAFNSKYDMSTYDFNTNFGSNISNVITLNGRLGYWTEESFEYLDSESSFGTGLGVHNVFKDSQQQIQGSTIELRDYDNHFEWWIETINYQGTSSLHGSIPNITVKTAVMLFYDKSGELVDMRARTQQTINGEKSYVGLYISKELSGLINNSIEYHNPYSQSALSKWWDFVSSKDPNAPNPFKGKKGHATGQGVVR